MNFLSHEFSFFRQSLYKSGKTTSVVRQHIFNFKGNGLLFTQIRKLFMNEDWIVCSKKSICKCWRYLKSYNWLCESENWRWKERGIPYWMFHFYRPVTVQEQNSELTANELLCLNVASSTAQRARQN